VFVLHGSLTTKPTQKELKSLSLTEQVRVEEEITGNGVVESR